MEGWHTETDNPVTRLELLRGSRASGAGCIEEKSMLLENHTARVTFLGAEGRQQGLGFVFLLAVLVAYLFLSFAVSIMGTSWSY